MALKNEWQEQRTQRRQEKLLRQQQVRHSLAEKRKQRRDFHHLAPAPQNKGEHSPVGEGVPPAGEIRDREAENRLSLAQQFYPKLKKHTQAFLSSTGSERQARARQLAARLDQYVGELQRQTRQFLALTATERSQMRSSLTKELGDFHKTLIVTVAQLRQSIQSEQRLTREKLAEDLATYIESLRSDMRCFLQQLKLARAERSQKLQQSFQQNRAQRSASMRALFQSFASFRAQLREYRASLRQSVWGTPTPSPEPAASPTTAIAQTAADDEPEAAQAVSLAHEQQVYDYIQGCEVVRVADIETALALNRVQVVDILNSLLTKGLIVQGDRTYTVQQEVSQ
jgi:hypothetical protein